jgi:hypothetical protein
VVLTNVVPVIDIVQTSSVTAVETDTISTATTSKVSPYYRLFPTPITIPPNTAHFEVELRVKPLVEGVSLRFTGVQVVVNFELISICD